MQTLKIIAINIVLLITINLPIFINSPANLLGGKAGGDRSPVYAAAPKTYKFSDNIGEPDRLVIKKINIDIKIDSSVFNNNTNSWDVPYSNVGYISPDDENGAVFNGNMVIFGHNRNDVLAPIRQLSSGDELIVTTTKGLNATYVYRGRSEVVTPENTSVIDNKTAPQLTLLTCDGAWSENRLLMFFDPVSIQESVL